MVVEFNGDNSKEIVDLVEKANLPMSYISQGLGDKNKTLFIETMQGTHIVRKGDTVLSLGRKIFVA